MVETWAEDAVGDCNDGYPWLPSAVFTPLPEVSIAGSACVEEGNQIVLEVTLPDGKDEYTIEWFNDGELIWSGEETTFVILHATRQHDGVYYAIVTDSSQTSLRTPQFRVRVVPEGLPVANIFGLVMLMGILALGAVHHLKSRA